MAHFRVGEPVRRLEDPRLLKWIAERSEVLLADEHGRDNVTDAELALDDHDGRFVALRVRTFANCGAYYNSDRNAGPARSPRQARPKRWPRSSMADRFQCVLADGRACETLFAHVAPDRNSPRRKIGRSRLEKRG